MGSNEENAKNYQAAYVIRVYECLPICDFQIMIISLVYTTLSGVNKAMTYIDMRLSDLSVSFKLTKKNEKWSKYTSDNLVGN